MSTFSMLRVSAGKIIDAEGHAVRLRGICIGGWMNLENFMNGYPGTESGLRRVMAETLGHAKATFFFDRLLDYFVTEEDIAFIRSVGANVVRLALNYRHFEDDHQPFVYRAEAFARLDRVVNWCAEHQLYVILDLHAVQGWQNTDWHSDNANRHALLWGHPHFQDRFVALWQALARHYIGNPAIAGYNLMNEPVSSAPFGLFPTTYQPDYDAMNALYRRTVTAIRDIDPDHLIFLEGDRFSQHFAGLEPPFAPNLVYSSHNYTSEGFGPGRYPGEFNGRHSDAAELERQFLATEGIAFTRQHEVPLWVGEFGVPYDGIPEEVPDRLRALEDQIALLNRHQVHWTTWTYKDIGVMGWVHLDPASPYMQTIAPVLSMKRALHADFWQQWLPPTRASQIVDDLAEEMAQIIALPLDMRKHRNYLRQVALEIYGGGLMQQAYAARFVGRSEDELDVMLGSFAFEHCRPHDGLVSVMRATLAQPLD